MYATLDTNTTCASVRTSLRWALFLQCSGLIECRDVRPQFRGSRCYVYAPLVVHPDVDCPIASNGLCWSEFVGVHCEFSAEQHRRLGEWTLPCKDVYHVGGQPVLSWYTFKPEACERGPHRPCDDVNAGRELPSWMTVATPGSVTWWAERDQG